MKKSIIFLSLILTFTSASAQINSELIKSKYGEIAERIIKYATKDSSSWERMAYICDNFGHRLAGSTGLEQALDYIASEMRKEKYDRVVEDTVRVPHWERGLESLEMISPRHFKMPVSIMCYSANTPKEGITAQAIVVKNFDELKAKAEQIKGKIVVYCEPFIHYGQAVQYRWDGASQAAKYGAVATLFRSVTSMAKYQTHLGSMGYEDSTQKIPNGALTPEDAEMLERMQKRGEKIVLKLNLESKEYPDALSRNVFCELKGSEKPDEIIAMGGHSDCWDNARGAQDDAGPCVVVWEALKILKELNLKPKRTIRAVWWVNEENGLRGGKAYTEKYAKEKHVLMLENDAGVFTPKGLRYNGDDNLKNIVESASKLLSSLNSDTVVKGGGGADISPLTKKGVPSLTLDMKNDNYFWFHHSPMDTPDKINPDDMNKSSAIIAIMIYILANEL